MLTPNSTSCALLAPEETCVLVGTYTVTASGDGGCTGTASLPVTVGLAPTFAIGVDEGCYRTLVAAPTATSYLWNTGATTQMLLATSGATYSVNATDTLGCSGSGEVTVP
jgi:hypothetical protein